MASFFVDFFSKMSNIKLTKTLGKKYWNELGRDGNNNGTIARYWLQLQFRRHIVCKNSQEIHLRDMI